MTGEDETQRLHTEQWGDQDGAVGRALLLHGITSSAATMWEIGEGLAAAGWSATAVDLPGHGDSGPDGSYRFSDLADRIVAQLGDGWDLVVAHSLGGAVATELLARHPAFASRALLIDPALVADTALAEGLLAELERDQREQTEETVAAANPHWHPRTVTERVRSTQATDAVAARGYADQNRPWDVRPQAREVQVPVHVLVPTSGAVVTRALIDELSTSTEPQWTFETVPDTTHSVHRDRPQVVIERALG